MATAQIGSVLQHLRRAVLRQDGAGCTDAQLLASFIETKDEAAFQALVRRHGPMVFGVCHRLVGNHHDAEDAFQATFLVLARKATSVKPRAGVANWLHGVALRTAMKARTMTAKRRGREKQVTQMPEHEVTQQDQWRDLRPLLDKEVNALPENYRLPIVLCDLEGKTIKEATQQLGWPQGTLASRLTRGRKLLATRLVNRGVVLSAVSLAAVVSQNAASAKVPTALLGSTVKAATMIAAGQAAVAGVVPAKVAALMEGVMMNMMLSKLTITTVGLFLAALLIGAVGAAYQRQATEQEKQVVDAPKEEPARAKNEAASQVAHSPPEADFQRLYAVTTRLVEAGADQPKTVHSPKLTFPEGQTGKVFIDDGRKNLLEKVIQDENIKIGTSIDVRVKRLQGNKARLFLSIAKNEVEKADVNEIRVLGSSVQAIQDVELHKAVKVVFQKDSKGLAQRWIEFTVDELTSADEQPIPPPVSRGPSPAPAATKN